LKAELRYTRDEIALLKEECDILRQFSREVQQKNAIDERTIKHLEEENIKNKQHYESKMSVIANLNKKLATDLERTLVNFHDFKEEATLKSQHYESVIKKSSTASSNGSKE